MKMIILLIGIVFGQILFAGCEKLGLVQWVYYDCADKWGQNTVAEDEKKENIISYFKDKGIKILKVEITDDGVLQTCNSCGCKSGNRIKCKVKDKNVAAMKNEGFYE